MMNAGVKVIRQIGAGILFLCAGSAYAIPQLQLTIEDGAYVGGTQQTTFATGNSFVLYALLTPSNSCDASCVNALRADTYYISAAVVPKTGPTGAALGSFSLNGTSYHVTAAMTYGTPPLETVASQLSDPGDLSSHGIYETFFREFAFNFVSANSTTPFNVQPSSDPADGPPSDPLAPGAGMYFISFEIDVSDLAENVMIHFDLYNSEVLACRQNPNCVAGDIDVNDFAPYSHDAQSSPPGGGPPTGVPEPGSLALIGAGLLGIGAIRRRRKA